MKHGTVKVTLNKDQKLYVFTHNVICGECGRPKKGQGYVDCFGFDNLFHENVAIAAEIERADLLINNKIGTMKAYRLHKKLIRLASERQKQTGKRLEAGLTPELKGLEGKRVEVVDCHGERRRFKVGKSTGVIPIHLELARADSMGGGGVTGTPFQSVKVIN